LHQQKGGSWWQSQPHLFYGPDGAEGGIANEGDGTALGRLATDEKGDLFAVTYAGTGASGGGTVLELQPRKDGWKPKVIQDFPGAAMGSKSGLISDLRGHFYGTTQRGGSGGYGSIYEIEP
jgi:uncharacterized repeat protein (TIGR03803 family)